MLDLYRGLSTSTVAMMLRGHLDFRHSRRTAGEVGFGRRGTTLFVALQAYGACWSLDFVRMFQVGLVASTMARGSGYGRGDGHARHHVVEKILDEMLDMLIQLGVAHLDFTMTEADCLRAIEMPVVSLFGAVRLDIAAGVMFFLGAVLHPSAIVEFGFRTLRGVSLSLGVHKDISLWTIAGSALGMSDVNDIFIDPPEKSIHLIQSSAKVASHAHLLCLDQKLFGPFDLGSIGRMSNAVPECSVKDVLDRIADKLFKALFDAAAHALENVPLRRLALHGSIPIVDTHRDGAVWMAVQLDVCAPVLGFWISAGHPQWERRYPNHGRE